MMKTTTRWCVVSAVVILGACGGSSAPANEPAPAPEISKAPTEPASAAPKKDEPAAAPKPLEAKDVVGSWKTSGGDFEEITIEADGSWSSFLHARPFYSGTWTLTGGTLTLTSPQAGAPMVFGQLERTDTGIRGQYDGKPATWTRVDSK